MSVFNLNKKSHINSLAFFDPAGGVTLQRYDTLKYRQFDKLTDKQLGFFWRPEEVDVGHDSKDFKELTEFEQHIFTSNLKRQILLDSVQGRAPSAAFGPIASLPELETWIATWTFQRDHSQSQLHSHHSQRIQ
jgi:ribonucleoside-diphosphate reductase beta chain